MRTVKLELVDAAMLASHSLLNTPSSWMRLTCALSCRRFSAGLMYTVNGTVLNDSSGPKDVSGNVFVLAGGCVMCNEWAHAPILGSPEPCIAAPPKPTTTTVRKIKLVVYLCKNNGA